MLFNFKPKNLNLEFLDVMLNHDIEHRHADSKEPLRIQDSQLLNLLQQVAEAIGVKKPSRDLIGMISDLQVELKKRLKKLQYYNDCNKEKAIVCFLAVPKNKELLGLLAYLKTVNTSLNDAI